MTFAPDAAARPGPLAAARRKPKLLVHVGGPGKNLLRHVSSWKILYRPSDYVGPLQPHVVLFPSSQNNDFVRRAAEVPDDVWARARRGAGKIVFDASLEGRPHFEQTSTALHRFLGEAGVGLDAGVYVTQNREYGREYQAYCARLGLTRTMKVVYYDYWLRRFVSDYEVDGETVFAARLAAFRARGRRRPRRFLSLNLTLRPTKILFLLSLLRDGLWDSGFVSYGGFERTLQTTNKTIAKLQKITDAIGFEALNAELSPLLPRLDAIDPIILGAPASASDMEMVHDEALPEYAASWLSVVTETEMLAQPCRITEKPLKALVNFHPFLVLGNPGALKMIRDLGFQTFPELIDESYDEELDPRRRFDMVYAELKRLIALDETELARREAVVAEKLVFNAEWGLTRLPHIFRDEIDDALIRDILAPA